MADDTTFEITSSFDKDKYPEKWEKAMDRALPTIGLFLQGEAMVRVPVKSGRLRGSLTYATTRSKSGVRFPAKQQDRVQSPYDKDEVWVGTNVEYGPYVEYGTKFSKAKPYLRPALDDNRDRVTELYQREVHKEMA